MKTKSIPSSWLSDESRRLDCGPYLAGALEAKLILKTIPAQKVPLYSLTKGYNNGIFNGPQFSRVWTKSLKEGVRFIGSGSMLRADLSQLPLLCKSYAFSKKLSYLKLEKFMTIISCSGSIGRMIYVRPKMDDIWSSQHIMKVNHDDKKIQAGFLYAYLNSKYGVPQVVSGTYGAIIQHIEPHQIENLPVPRLGKSIENKIHQLMSESANLLDKYQNGILASTKSFFSCMNLEEMTSDEWSNQGPDIGFSEKFPNQNSLRALNFNPRYKSLCEQIKKGPYKTLGEICIPGTLQRGGRFKRIDAEPEFAYKLIGQKQLFWLKPEGRWIAKSAVGKDVLVEPGTILVAARGTLGESELYCRSEFIWGPATGNAYSEDLLRIIADEQIMLRGCLYAFLRSETAFRMLRSISVGTKLQDHHHIFRKELPIPYPSLKQQREIHDMVVEAYENRHKAIELEDEAIQLVEKEIESLSR